jgi:NAD(P)H dehydrogenase (quinone)
MILVTGSTGHLGKATIKFLLNSIPASEIAALARDKDKAAEYAEKGIDLRIGNYNDYASLQAATKGIDTILLISSADMADRITQHINVMKAAKDNGVKHIIYTSADVKDINDSATGEIAETHAATSKFLRQSGITYTLLNNNLYADVVPMFVGEKVLETGVYLPAGEGKVPFATREDMAEAAAVVLTTAGHENKEYTIAGETAYSFREIAQMLSDVTEKEVPYTSPAPEEYRTALTAAGVPEFFIGMLGNFATAIKNSEFDTQNTDLTQLLGRKPTSLKDYLQLVFGAK